MKRLFIYFKDEDQKKFLLRTITVHSSFVGNGKQGINPGEFKKLSEDLEPTSNYYSIVDA